MASAISNSAVFHSTLIPSFLGKHSRIANKVEFDIVPPTKKWIILNSSSLTRRKGSFGLAEGSMFWFSFIGPRIA